MFKEKALCSNESIVCVCVCVCACVFFLVVCLQYVYDPDSSV